jgi:hypothetical protein
LLGGLLIIARLVVVSATLNASLWQRKRLGRLHSTWGWVAKPADLWRRDQRPDRASDLPEVPVLDSREPERPT